MGEISLTEEQAKIHGDIIDWVMSVATEVVERSKRKTVKDIGIGPFEVTGGFESLFEAIDRLTANPMAPSKYKSLGGLAGTGKTTLVAALINDLQALDVRTALMAYTGRAASVLYRKCSDAGATPNSCTTIHRFLYRPVFVGKDTAWIRYNHEELRTVCDLIIVDEASMVPKKIFDDLRHTGFPILFVGDHGQLPPIDGGSDFNIMKSPNWRLNKIHRQAEESPIIRLAHKVRQGLGLSAQRESGDGELIVAPSRTQAGTDIMKMFMGSRAADQDIILLCGMNRTRVTLNKRARAALKFDTPIPAAGEKVVCLKNDSELGIMNGYIGKVIDSGNLGPERYSMIVDFDGEVARLPSCHPITLGKQEHGKEIKKVGYQALRGVGVFDFGYAVSVHKAQGSEWPVALLCAERNQHQSDEDYAKWLYTGITRAKRKLAVLF